MRMFNKQETDEIQQIVEDCRQRAISVNKAVEKLVDLFEKIQDKEDAQFDAMMEEAENIH